MPEPITAIFCRVEVVLEVKAIEHYRSSAPFAGWFLGGYVGVASTVHCDPTWELGRTMADARAGLRPRWFASGVSSTPEDATGA
ncbi:MAG: hypothetical protein R3C31_03390 [Hyphomonadaceae bacterium]